jgi:hypothetical protein
VEEYAFNRSYLDPGLVCEQMDLYVFSSKNLTNIWAGIGAKMWAVSDAQASNAAIRTKAQKLPIGTLGLFYCVEVQSLTTPFLIRTKPDEAKTITNVWPEAWQLPFAIAPLGSPILQVHKDRLGSVLPSLQSGSRNWDNLFHIQPVTVFAPSTISDNDWAVLVTELAST